MIFKIKNLRFKINSCKDEDYWFVYNLLKRNMYPFFKKYWGGWNPKSFREGFNKKNIKIIRYKNKRIAYYDFKLEQNYSYINNIQVSGLMRGKGLGTFLLNLMEKESKKYNLNRIRLKVFKDNPAKNLYLRLGYKKIKNENFSLILEKKI
jgi:ribosomal protein S18 acetylase RimI-like enzyme